MPGPIYNWLCVAHSIVDVLSNAAVIRASQVYPRTASAAIPRNLKRRTAQPVNLAEEELGPLVGVDAGARVPFNALDGTEGTHIGTCVYAAHAILWYLSSCVGTPPTLERPVQRTSRSSPEFTLAPPSPGNPPKLRIDEPIVGPRESKLPTQAVFMEKTPLDVASATGSAVDNSSASLPDPQVLLATTDGPRSIPPSEARQLTSSKIPSSRIGRLFHYGGVVPHVYFSHQRSDTFTGLAASLGYGAASEILRRSVSSEESSQNGGSLMMTESNVKRLVTKLTRMRGAALKLGQFMSIQGALRGSFCGELTIERF